MTRQCRRKRPAEWKRFNRDDLAEPEGTLDVLSDPKALADIREADLALHGRQPLAPSRRGEEP